MKILIVEDSATLRASMKKMVLETGHTPLFANSGIEALQMLGSTDFDLVIMDVEMPGLDGFETTSLMREALGDRWIPIIYSTRPNSDDRVLAGIEAGGDDYLVKPISLNLLKAKLTSMQRIAKMHQQLSRLNEELAALSQVDGLTRLLNRRAFVEKAEHSLRDVRRFGKTCALLMMDVDFFKQYNDHYGHLQGDECLKQIADTLQHNAHRESDLVGRYGGEEFVMLLPDTDTAGATHVAQKILRSIDELNIAHALSGAADHVTLSIGIEIAASSDRCTLETLLASADKNLYQAKATGRHRVVSTNIGNTHKTLLIVDNSEERLLALTERLQPLGNIITTDCPRECLELAKEIVPDVIVLGHLNSNGETPEKMIDILANHVRTARVPIFAYEDIDAVTPEQIYALL